MKINKLEVLGLDWAFSAMRMPYLSHDKSTKFADFELARRLAKLGTEHRKYLRQITIHIDMTASMAFWFEFDTYKIGVTSNSASLWHTFGKRDLVLDDFIDLSSDLRKPMQDIIDIINKNDDLPIEQKRMLIPQGVKYRRIVTMNAEAYLNMCKQRKSHRLAEWRAFVQSSQSFLWNKNKSSPENTLYSILCDEINK